MNLEAGEQQDYEDDRAYLDSLILQLKDKDPEKSQDARKELESMLGVLRIAYFQANNALKVMEVAKNKDKNMINEKINEKIKEQKLLSDRIELIRNALNSLKKPYPVFNLKPLRPKRSQP